MYENIRLFLFDVDGVLTDGTIVFDASGQETKAFNVKDGAAMKWLGRAGIAIGMLTGRTSDAVKHRATDLGIEILYQGAKVKLDALAELLAKHGYSEAEVAYMGDDLIDLPVMRAVALSFAPADARPEVVEEATFVTRSAGGRGAARDAIEILLKGRGQWREIVARYGL